MIRTLALVAGLCAAGSALAADPAGHAKYHSQFYKHLMIPGTQRSCCNDRDCRPVPHRVTLKGVEVQANGHWFIPPKHRTMTKVTPDGGAHLCSVPNYDGSEYVFCAILPFNGF